MIEKIQHQNVYLATNLTRTYSRKLFCPERENIAKLQKNYLSYQESDLLLFNVSQNTIIL